MTNGRGICIYDGRKKIQSKPTNRESWWLAGPFTLETLAHIEVRRDAAASFVQLPSRNRLHLRYEVPRE